MALKDKLMTLEDFKAVRDVDVASNSAQFTEIKADLGYLISYEALSYTLASAISTGSVGQTRGTTVSQAWRCAAGAAIAGYKYKCTYTTPKDNVSRPFILFCDDDDVIISSVVHAYSTNQTVTEDAVCPEGATRIYVNACNLNIQYSVDIEYAINPISYTEDSIAQIETYIGKTFTETTTTDERSLISGSVGNVITRTVSQSWRSGRVPVVVGRRYKCTYSTPKDNTLRPYILFTNDSGVIISSVSHQFTAYQAVTEEVICPEDATMIYVNAYYVNSAYTLIVEELIDGTEIVRKSFTPTLGLISKGEIILPEKIHVAAGTQCFLTWSAIANIAEGDKSVYFELQCDVGKMVERGFVLDATAAMDGTHTITINCRDAYTRKIIGTYAGSIVVHSIPTISGAKNLLMIGDSRTAGNSDGVQGTSYHSASNRTITTEVKALLDADNPSVFTTIGTYASASDSTIKNLAVSGWKVTNATNVITTAGGMSEYVDSATGVSGTNLDVCTLMFGVNDISDWNDNNIGQYDISTKRIETFIENVKTLVDMIIADYPQCKIIIVIEPTTCASQDGFGYSVTNNTPRDAHLEFEYAQKALRKQLITTFDGAAYNANVIVSSAGIWCDRLYGFPYITEKPSGRVSVKTVDRWVNNVHPHDDGYKQIADGIFGTIIDAYS